MNDKESPSDRKPIFITINDNNIIHTEIGGSTCEKEQLQSEILSHGLRTCSTI